MNVHLILCAGLLIGLSSYGQKPSAIRLPATRRQPVTDTYFGKAVVDNYRWLEDMKSDEVKD